MKTDVKECPVGIEEQVCKQGDLPSECTNVGATHFHCSSISISKTKKCKGVINDDDADEEEEEEQEQVDLNRKLPLAIISYDDEVSPTDSHDGGSSVASSSHPNSPQTFLNLDEVHLKEHEDYTKVEMGQSNVQHHCQKRMRDDEDNDEQQKKKNGALSLQEMTNTLTGQKSKPIRHTLASE